MVLPAGVTTCLVFKKAPVSFGGSTGGVEVEIAPSVRLVHTETGTPLADFIEAVAPAEGGVAQVMLPHTDQPGFQDEAGNSFTNWHYTARIRLKKAGQQVKSLPTFSFQIPSGQTEVDLSLVPSGVAALASSAPIATVTSLNGRTGQVVILATDLPAHLSEEAITGSIENPSTDVNLIEEFGEAAPKILRVRSSSTPGVGVGANAGRSAIFEVGDSRAKSMIDYRFPLKADGTIWNFNDGAPPEDAYKSVAWFGVCHYWAQDQPDHNNPTDLHNHISILEMPDQNRDLHTIFDSPIGSSADPGAIGAASHRIRTNRSDFLVRVGNPYDAALNRAYRLKVTAAPEYEKLISFHANTSGETSGSNMAGVRWEVGVLGGAETGADAGSNFVIQRYTDSGFSQRRSFMFGDRATGKVTFGKEASGLGNVNSIWQDTARDGFYGYPELGIDATNAVYAGHTGSVTNKVFRSVVGSSSPTERFNILGDGKMQWGNTTTIDTNLYRSQASTLATDDDFEITLSSKGLIQKSANGTRWRLTVGNDGTITTTAL